MRIVCFETRDGYEYINPDQIVSFRDCAYMPGYSEMFLNGETEYKKIVRGTAQHIADMLRTDRSEAFDD